MKFFKVTALVITVLTKPVWAEEVVEKIASNVPDCPVRFMGEMTDESLGVLLDNVNNCDSYMTPVIQVQTGGGKLDPTMYVYHLLRERGVNTEVGYSIASAGVILFLAGETRKMRKGGYILLHEVTRSTGDSFITSAGPANETFSGIKIAEQDYIQVVVSRTGQSYDQVEDWMRAHTFLTSEEALKYGFATELTE